MKISHHGEKKSDIISRWDVPTRKKIDFFTREILATHQTVSIYTAKWCLEKNTQGLVYLNTKLGNRQI